MALIILNSKVFLDQAMLTSRTCRYSETINLLYTRTHFILHQNDTLSDFRSAVLPVRLSSIRSLTLHWQFRSYMTFERNVLGKLESKVFAPWDVKTWEQACKILESMTELRELVIDVRGGFMYEGYIADMLEYLRGVNAQAFRVRVPWPRIRVKMGADGWGNVIKERGFRFEIVRDKIARPDPYLFLAGPELYKY